jgi:hypothetical protein
MPFSTVVTFGRVENQQQKHREFDDAIQKDGFDRWRASEQYLVNLVSETF